MPKAERTITINRPPEEVFRFHRDRGFRLEELTTCAGGLGCNQYVFSR